MVGENNESGSISEMKAKWLEWNEGWQAMAVKTKMPK